MTDQTPRAQADHVPPSLSRDEGTATCAQSREPLSARWQELFWALPPGPMRSKLRALEIDTGRRLHDADRAIGELLQSVSARTSERDQAREAIGVVEAHSAASPLGPELRALVAEWRGIAGANRRLAKKASQQHRSDASDLLCEQADAKSECADELDALLRRLAPERT